MCIAIYLSTPYPWVLGSTPYPWVLGSTPYPWVLGSTPYPWVLGQIHLVQNPGGEGTKKVSGRDVGLVILTTTQ